MSPDLHFSCAIANSTFNFSWVKVKAVTATTKVFWAQYNALSTIVAVLPWDFTVVIADEW